MSAQADFSDLLEAFERSDWQEMIVEIGGDRLHVSRRDGTTQIQSSRTASAAAAVTPNIPDAARAVSAPPEEAPAAAPLAVPITGQPVTSPSVGIFWRAPAPTSPPFVEVGSVVDADDTIGIVEVMKLMQQVAAGVSGTVTSVDVGNGQTVEYGVPLVHIDPATG